MARIFQYGYHLVTPGVSDELSEDEEVSIYRGFFRGERLSVGGMDFA